MTENEMRESVSPASSPNEENKKESVVSLLLEVVRFSAIALLFIVPIRIFIAQPYIVSGASMDPTFKNGEYLIVDQLSYRMSEPVRGEVVIFRFPKDPSKYFIKRVIGLPGEKITFANGVFSVTKKEGGMVTFKEEYLRQTFSDSFERELAEDEYFMMGDNRRASLDSRAFGALPRRFIVGRALVRLLPPTNIGVFPGFYAYPEEIASE